MTAVDFTAALREESRRFRAALSGVGDVAVATCPSWSTNDLLWHLSDVQWFWGTIVSRNVADPPALRHEARPVGRDALLAAFDRATHLLQTSMESVPPNDARWMWTADDSLHTAGYIARRQAHEALIHRVDAELAAGRELTSIDPVLAADGIEEVVEVMYGREDPALVFSPTEGHVIELVATDTGRRWVLQLGREISTDLETGRAIVASTFRVAQGATARATVAGDAEDLDLWLWNRPPTGQVTRTGDRATLNALFNILKVGLQ